MGTLDCTQQRLPRPWPGLVVCRQGHRQNDKKQHDFQHFQDLCHFRLLLLLQNRRKDWKSGGASSNQLAINQPPAQLAKSRGGGVINSLPPPSDFLRPCVVVALVTHPDARPSFFVANLIVITRKITYYYQIIAARQALAQQGEPFFEAVLFVLCNCVFTNFFLQFSLGGIQQLYYVDKILTFFDPLPLAWTIFIP